MDALSSLRLCGRVRRWTEAVAPTWGGGCSPTLAASHSGFFGEKPEQWGPHSNPYRLLLPLPADLYLAIACVGDGELWPHSWQSMRGIRSPCVAGGWAEEQPSIGRQLTSRVLVERAASMFLILFIYLNSERAGPFLEHERTASGEGRGKMSYYTPSTTPLCHVQARSRAEALYSPSNPKT